MRICLFLCMLSVCLLAYVMAKGGGRGGRSVAGRNSRGITRRKTIQESSSRGSGVHQKSGRDNPNINVNSILTSYSLRNGIRKNVRNTAKKSMDPKRSGNQQNGFENTHLGPQKSRNGLVHSRSMPNIANGVMSKRSKRSARRTRLPTLKFDCSNMPHICDNMREAIDSGKPQYLSRSRSRTSKNRYAACGDAGAGAGMSCDEYPYASTKQGGKGARIAYVPIKENYSQGGQLSAFYRKYGIKSYGPKSRFKVARPE